MNPTRLTTPPQADALRRAVADARDHLLSLQRDDFWCAELEGDTILESEYVLLLAFLGEERSEVAVKAARYILSKQQADGSWSNYPDGPIEVSVSTKAYFALKLTGHDPAAPYMVKARRAILAAGGAERCNSFTKFYLAFLGQMPFASVPSVPVELILLPRWFPINLYAMSSWSRTIVVPLSIFSAFKPVKTIEPARGIAELFASPTHAPASAAATTYPFFSWERFFLNCDRAYKAVEGWLGPFRRRAVRLAAAWMRERNRDSDGLGAIFPPMIYTIIALRCLGVPADDPEIVEARRVLDELIIEEPDTLRLQPCFSPVWDTALTLNALAESGDDVREPAVARAVEWLLAKEVRVPGDWSLANPKLAPSGWYFEYRNPFYPDTDDTSMVLMALARTGALARPDVRAAADRAVPWMLGMQNRDGGFAAFDRDITLDVLTRVPFADHNAMLDPSCPDITARVLEALGPLRLPRRPAHGRSRRRVHRADAGPRGCWPGRWGVNYLYGTWQVLLGLEAVGYDMTRPDGAQGSRLARRRPAARRRLGRKLRQLRRSRPRRVRAR